MSILDKIAGMGIGETLDGIGDLAESLRQAITGDLPPDKKAEVQKQINDLKGKAMAAKAKTQDIQGEIIMAEAKAQSWLQRNWRPLSMMTFVAIIANNYIIMPYVSLFVGKTVYLNFPSAFWAALTTGIGGYIGAKTVERIKRVRPEQQRQ